MPASSLREEAQATVSNKHGHRGEREVSRKTIARGMPGDFRCDRGDYARMLVLFCMRGCGCIERPAFPAPSVSWANGSCKTRTHRAARSRTYVGIEATSLRGAEATKQSILPLWPHGLLRGACHRAAPCADPLARNDGLKTGCLKSEIDM